MSDTDTPDQDRFYVLVCTDASADTPQPWVLAKTVRDDDEPVSFFTRAEADEIARQINTADIPTTAHIAEWFGACVVDPGDRIDEAVLAALQTVNSPLLPA
jgi:hypothetical protein